MTASRSPATHCRTEEAGFTLLEALAALAIVALVVTSFLGIRTSALIDATYARNWRLARELAEEKMSELLAGARETPPEPGAKVPFDKYPGFAFEIVIGESAVAEIESKVAAASGDGEAGSSATERAEWQRNREMYRKAAAKGQSYMDYQDQLVQDDYRRRLEEQAPSETEFEEAAVVVWFPRVNSYVDGAEDAFVIKAKVSTLALTGMTPEQADASAKARGLTAGAAAAGGAAGGGNPLGGSALGGNTGGANTGRNTGGNTGGNRSGGK